jgi:hypothetical protein
MRKKRIVFFVLVALVIFIGFLLVHKNPRPKTATSSNTSSVEKGSNGGSQSTSVGVENGEQLYNYLLPEQYTAVQQALGRYVSTEVSPNVTVAYIVQNSTVLNNDGSINFSVQVSQPATTFTVLVQRPSANVLIFSVPANNYSYTLYPYDGPNASSGASSD